MKSTYRNNWVFKSKQQRSGVIKVVERFCIDHLQERIGIVRELQLRIEVFKRRSLRLENDLICLHLCCLSFHQSLSLRLSINEIHVVIGILFNLVSFSLYDLYVSQ